MYDLDNAYIHFYPRSPCGERQVVQRVTVDVSRFLSTLSLRRATLWTNFAPNPKTFLSTLSLRRATGMPGNLIMILLFLSTLSLRRATICCADVAGAVEISIHALLAESDLDFVRAQFGVEGFLSTLSLRRATGAFNQRYRIYTHFYPRSPCGERRDVPLSYSVKIIFLSTLSLRRATVLQS